MKKRVLCATLVLCLWVTLLAGTGGSAIAAGTIAVKSNQAIYVDNVYVDMTMYLIGGNNYVRLRDVGMAVGFNVIYDSETRAIHIRTDEPYMAGPSVLGQTPETVEAQATIQTIYIDGEGTYISSYLIDGNNYVKLVNLGAAVGFGVSWDGTNKRVMVESMNPSAAVSTPAPNTATAQTGVSTMTTGEMKLEIIRLTNLERVKAGVPELKVLPELMDCAQAKADDMLANHYFGHVSPQFGSANDMVRAFVNGYRGAGENINLGGTTPEEVIEGWVFSPGHYQNLVDSRFTHIGIGIVVNSTGTLLWVQQLMIT